MTLNELYGTTKYLLGGGVLPLLAKALAERVDGAVILQPEGRDLHVFDAVGPFVPPSLPGAMGYLERRFAAAAGGWRSLPIDEEGRALFPAPWSHVVLLGEGGHVVVVLLDREPDEAMGPLLEGADGLVRLWNRYRSLDEAERSLDSLAYLLYAVKSAFPSVFEPFPPDFLAAFLVDVLRESFGPERLTLLRDEGGEFRRVAGDEGPLPLRQGLFVARNLAPVPVPIEASHKESLGGENVARLGGTYSVVLPLFAGDRRFFYLLRWGSSPRPEGVHVLELMGGVTSKAMALNALREEREERIRELSAREFSLGALHRALLSLIRKESSEALLEELLDVFGEMTQSRRVLAAVHDRARGAYRLFGERRDGRVFSLDGSFWPAPEPLEVVDLPLSCPASSARTLFAVLGLEMPPEEALPEEMDRLFLLVDGRAFLGYVALAPSVTGGAYGDGQNLETLAAASAVTLSRCRLLEEGRR